MTPTYSNPLVISFNATNCSYLMQLLENSGYRLKTRNRLKEELEIFDEYTEITLISNMLSDDKDNQLVQDTCLYMQKNLSKKLMLDDVAIKMGSNRSKLAATFKQVLGIGVFEWVRKHRMLKAKSLLVESRLSIQEVGFEVGYENSANFSSAFKKYFKISPRQQRKSVKIK